MGAAIGSALNPAAGVVIWAAAGRSMATSKRAELADLVSVPDPSELARRANLIVSVCPPEAAMEVALEVAAAFVDRPDPPLYLEANAVAPDTVRAIGDLLGPDRGRRPGGRPAGVGARAHRAVALRTAGPTVGRCSRGPRSRRGCSALGWGRQRLAACFGLATALPAIWRRWPRRRAATGSAELREELARMARGRPCWRGGRRAAANAWRGPTRWTRRPTRWPRWASRPVLAGGRGVLPAAGCAAPGRPGQRVEPARHSDLRTDHRTAVLGGGGPTSPR